MLQTENVNLVPVQELIIVSWRRGGAQAPQAPPPTPPSTLGTGLFVPQCSALQPRRHIPSPRRSPSRTSRVVQQCNYLCLVIFIFVIGLEVSFILSSILAEI